MEHPVNAKPNFYSVANIFNMNIGSTAFGGVADYDSHNFNDWGIFNNFIILALFAASPPSTFP